jgi:hypothetical protein
MIFLRGHMLGPDHHDRRRGVATHAGRDESPSGRVQFELQEWVTLRIRSRQRCVEKNLETENF